MAISAQKLLKTLQVRLNSSQLHVRARIMPAEAGLSSE
jgi:hypothetical protein